MMSERDTLIDESNPLLFLSEQLLNIAQSSTIQNTSEYEPHTQSVQVSDDDGSPMPGINMDVKRASLQDDSHMRNANEPVNDHNYTSSETNIVEDMAVENNSEDSLSEKKSVVTVVAKAKRAAASLWMVLHAQTCRFGGDKCPLQGCLETKHLLLHVKSCTAESDTNCPEQVSGCTQARKLMAHYRRCREIRAKQRHQSHLLSSLSSTSFSVPSTTPHSCLICSLMARHACSILESTAAATTLASIGSGISKKSSEISSPSSKIMPPPPPRPRTCSLGSMPQKPTLLGSTASARIVPLPPNITSLGSSINSSQQDNIRRRKHQDTSFNRPRATSFDERKAPASSSTSMSYRYKNKKFPWLSSLSDNDPTVEFRLRSVQENGDTEDGNELDQPKEESGNGNDNRDRYDQLLSKLDGVSDEFNRDDR